MVEGANAADASGGLVAGAHPVNGIELLPRSGAGRSFICVGCGVCKGFLEPLAARGWDRDRARGQTGQRRTALQESSPVSFFRVHGSLLKYRRS